MKTTAEYTKHAERCREILERDRATLRRLKHGLLLTQLTIERASLAYVMSRWTLAVRSNSVSDSAWACAGLAVGGNRLCGFDRSFCCRR